MDGLAWFSVLVPWRSFSSRDAVVKVSAIGVPAHISPSRIVPPWWTLFPPSEQVLRGLFWSGFSDAERWFQYGPSGGQGLTCAARRHGHPGTGRVRRASRTSDGGPPPVRRGEGGRAGRRGEAPRGEGGGYGRGGERRGTWSGGEGGAGGGTETARKNTPWEILRDLAPHKGGPLGILPVRRDNLGDVDWNKVEEDIQAYEDAADLAWAQTIGFTLLALLLAWFSLDVVGL